MARWSRYNLLVADAEDRSLLVFNSRTGALSRLSESRVNDLQSQRALPPDFAEFLLRHGFLIDEACDELQLIRDSHKQAMLNRDTFTATVELTEACNFRCRYCYQGHRPGRMTPDAADRIMRYLVRRMAETSHLHINWFGGEPLLGLSQLRDIALRLREAGGRSGCRVTQFITTNGYLLTARVAAQLADLGVSDVQITLDGAARDHNALRPYRTGRPTYDRVLDGCANAVKAGMSLLLRINLSRLNENSIGAMLDDLPNHGLTPANTVIHVTRMVDHGRSTCDSEMSMAALDGPEFGKSWIRSLGMIIERGFPLPHLDPIPFNCPFDLATTVMIGHDGSLRHCSSSDAPIARLSDDGYEIDRTPLYDSVKGRDPLDDPRCRDCTYLPMCMGGCSYLQEIGQDKCAPERYVLGDLVALTARVMERR